MKWVTRRRIRCHPWPALRCAVWIALGVFVALDPALVAAFPPYRSTDAETADPGALEARLGLIRLEREGNDNEYTVPLARLNLGLRANFELIAEFEHPTDDERADEAAFGLKWASGPGAVSFGVESLALVPTSASHSGMGVESQLLATLRRGPFRVHMNAGGFYDWRPADDERGWRGSVLAERQQGRVRVGLELFAKKTLSERLRAGLGPGVILDVGPFDVRAGLHVGLTSETPDLALSFWIARQWKVWRRPARNGLSRAEPPAPRRRARTPGRPAACGRPARSAARTRRADKR